RCREDKVLVEALPDTLELLLRASMEGLNLAGERAKRKAIASSARTVAGGATGGAPTSVDGGGAVRGGAIRGGATRGGATRGGATNGGGGSGGSSGTARRGATAAVSELELARAVMSDCVYLAQLVPECFHEVVARVARKAEPERYALLFPMHLVVDGDGGERKSTAAAAAPAGSGSGRAGVG
ncbi:unnamed protein product, partial [Laminaria digitata]